MKHQFNFENTDHSLPYSSFHSRKKGLTRPIATEKPGQGLANQKRNGIGEDAGSKGRRSHRTFCQGRPNVARPFFLLLPIKASWEEKGERARATAKALPSLQGVEKVARLMGNSPIPIGADYCKK